MQKMTSSRGQTAALLRYLPSLAFGVWLHPMGRVALDWIVAWVWQVLHRIPVFHAPLAEALVATLGFWVSGTFFETLHCWWPSTDDLRINVHEQASISRRGEKKLEEARLRRSKPHRRRILRSVGFFLWTKVASSGLYLLAIWAFHAFVRPKPPLPAADAPPSAARFVVELIFGIWLYDLFFTPVHYFLHWSGKGVALSSEEQDKDLYVQLRGTLSQLRLLVGRVLNHRVHHEMKGTLAAGATVHHSLVDGTMQVLVNVLVQQLSPWHLFGDSNCTYGYTKHSLSRFAHNMVVTWLLCEAHSGYDLPWMTHRLWPEIFGGSVRHNAHHNKGNVYYQQFFKYIDDFFGTVEA